AFITVDAGDDDMLQTKRAHGFGYAVRFGPIERAGASGFDVAETAGTGAGVAHHEECRRAAPPAFAEVGTQGFFADGVQRLAAHQFADTFVFGSARCFDANPGRTAARVGRVWLPAFTVDDGNGVGVKEIGHDKAPFVMDRYYTACAAAGSTLATVQRGWRALPLQIGGLSRRNERSSRGRAARRYPC